MTHHKMLEHWLPVLRWARGYGKAHFAADTVAATVVTLMLVPQALAYAMLAGLPPETGLYASTLPLLAYALLGSSRSLAVGPAAVTSLMTAAAAGALAQAGTPAYTQAALWLALMSGVMLALMGMLRLGFIAQFLSHPVLSGFVSATGLLIAASQLKHLLGVGLQGQTLPALLAELPGALPRLHLPTLVVGAISLALLLLARRYAKAALLRLGAKPFMADLGSKGAPVLVIALSIVGSWYLGLAGLGVKVVGDVPAALPSLALPAWNAQTGAIVHALWVPALLISLVGFVESVSIGQSLAARHRERIEPSAELRGLGMSNIAASLVGGFPVTGGFSRSVVNYDAGARTPAAGLYTGLALLLAALFVTPLLRELPQATLAATIVVAVLSLVDFGAFGRIWRYARTDFIALLVTFVLTLTEGLEAGLIGGVSVSVVLLLYRSSRPHIAVVGRVPGTEHYRNVLRHDVQTQPWLLGLRVDESLYFANARYLEDHIAAQVAQRPAIRDVVLQCTAVNDIDASALESLETIDARLAESGVRLHLSEVKGPVMDRLRHSDFLRHLSGQVFLTHHQAVTQLTEDQSRAAGTSSASSTTR